MKVNVLGFEPRYSAPKAERIIHYPTRPNHCMPCMYIILGKGTRTKKHINHELDTAPDV